MQIKKLYRILFASMLMLAINSLASAQEFTSDGQIPPGKPIKEPYYSELEAFPEDLASDFPHYSTIVAYSFIAKQTDPEEIAAIKLKINSGELPPNYSVRNLNIYKVLKIRYNYTDATPRDICKWYEINTSNAGYSKIFLDEGAMQDTYHMRYEKTEGNILKRVNVDIFPDKIEVTAFEDKEIKKHPDYINAPIDDLSTTEPENN